MHAILSFHFPCKPKITKYFKQSLVLESKHWLGNQGIRVVSRRNTLLFVNLGRAHIHTTYSSHSLLDSTSCFNHHFGVVSPNKTLFNIYIKLSFALFLYATHTNAPHYSKTKYTTYIYFTFVYIFHTLTNKLCRVLKLKSYVQPIL